MGVCPARTGSASCDSLSGRLRWSVPGNSRKPSSDAYRSTADSVSCAAVGPSRARRSQPLPLPLLHKVLCTAICAPCTYSPLVTPTRHRTVQQGLLRQYLQECFAAGRRVLGQVKQVALNAQDGVRAPLFGPSRHGDEPLCQGPRAAGLAPRRPRTSRETARCEISHGVARAHAASWRTGADHAGDVRRAVDQPGLLGREQASCRTAGPVHRQERLGLSCARSQVENIA